MIRKSELRICLDLLQTDQPFVNQIKGYDQLKALFKQIAIDELSKEDEQLVESLFQPSKWLFMPVIALMDSIRLTQGYLMKLFKSVYKTLDFNPLFDQMPVNGGDFKQFW